MKHLAICKLSREPLRLYELYRSKPDNAMPLKRFGLTALLSLRPSHEGDIIIEETSAIDAAIMKMISLMPC